jgi:hypothetical protein
VNWGLAGLVSPLLGQSSNCSPYIAVFDTFSAQQALNIIFTTYLQKKFMNIFKYILNSD